MSSTCCHPGIRPRRRISMDGATPADDNEESSRAIRALAAEAADEPDHTQQPEPRPRKRSRRRHAWTTAPPPRRTARDPGHPPGRPHGDAAPGDGWTDRTKVRAGASNGRDADPPREPRPRRHATGFRSRDTWSRTPSRRRALTLPSRTTSSGRERQPRRHGTCGGSGGDRKTTRAGKARARVRGPRRPADRTQSARESRVTPPERARTAGRKTASRWASESSARSGPPKVSETSSQRGARGRSKGD